MNCSGMAICRCCLKACFVTASGLCAKCEGVQTTLSPGGQRVEIVNAAEVGVHRGGPSMEVQVEGVKG